MTKSVAEKYGIDPRPLKSETLCRGCRDDFYNGRNDLGVKRCWSFKTSKVVCKKLVHVDQVPPWRQKPEWVLSCYNRPRYVKVGPDQER